MRARPVLPTSYKLTMRRELVSSSVAPKMSGSLSFSATSLSCARILSLSAAALQRSMSASTPQHSRYTREERLSGGPCRLESSCPMTQKQSTSPSCQHKSYKRSSNCLNWRFAGGHCSAAGEAGGGTHLQGRGALRRGRGRWPCARCRPWSCPPSPASHSHTSHRCAAHALSRPPLPAEMPRRLRGEQLPVSCSRCVIYSLPACPLRRKQALSGFGGYLCPWRVTQKVTQATQGFSRIFADISWPKQVVTTENKPLHRA